MRAPAPIPAPTVADRHKRAFRGWRELEASGGSPGLDPWSSAHLGELAGLEATWADHAAGDTLLHGDLRADNMLRGPGGVTVVDWPHACRGAAFVGPGAVRPERGYAGWPGPHRAAAYVAVSGMRSGGPDLGALRPGGLLHPSGAAAATTRAAHGAGLPGRPGCRHPALAGRADLMPVLMVPVLVPVRAAVHHGQHRAAA
ncbi:MAG: phosphotransferase [Actinomycetota bacterium]